MMPIDVSLYLQHTENRGLVEVLLRSHLWVEKQVISLLEAELRNPAALNLDRLAFSQKVGLADALGMLRPDEVETLRILNALRNRLAHDLYGEPNETDVARLEAAVPESQRGLADKLQQVMDPPNTEELEAGLCRRLSAVVLALLTEMEQHRQWHAYWRQHRSAMEAYKLMVTVMEELGATPETEAEYRRALGIPDPPTPQDAVLQSKPGHVE